MPATKERIHITDSKISKGLKCWNDVTIFYSISNSWKKKYQQFFYKIFFSPNLCLWKEEKKIGMQIKLFLVN